MPRTDRNTTSVIWTAVLLTACGPLAPVESSLTYHGDGKPSVAQSCTGDHAAGGIAPFALTTC